MSKIPQQRDNDKGMGLNPHNVITSTSSTPLVIGRERRPLRGLASSSEEAEYVREWEKILSLEISRMQKILLGAELRKSSKTLDGSL
jgi:hypothetical protein